jgi:hypothetical protein
MTYSELGVGQIFSDVYIASILLCYTDECGSPDPHTVPLRDGLTPSFVLAAISLDSEK